MTMEGMSPEDILRMEQEQTVVTCPECGWEGSLGELREHWVGDALTEDVTPEPVCPNCGSSQIYTLVGVSLN